MLKMTYSVSRCLLSLLLGCMPLGFGWADGPADNHPANVRPVPPPGIVLTTARQQGLRDAVSHIRREVASIKELPETDAHQILVLARAIEMTIDHSMFYSDAEVAMADKVNDLLSNASRQPRRVNEAWPFLESKKTPTSSNGS